MNLTDLTLSQLIQLLHLEPEYINSMIYNVCDYTGHRCPFSKKKCNGNCYEQFELRINPDNTL